MSVYVYVSFIHGLPSFGYVCKLLKACISERQTAQAQMEELLWASSRRESRACGEIAKVEPFLESLTHNEYKHLKRYTARMPCGVFALNQDPNAVAMMSGQEQDCNHTWSHGEVCSCLIVRESNLLMALTLVPHWPSQGVWVDRICRSMTIGKHQT